ncbi:MAG: hypothetical protein J5766_04280, partial [Clostridia bacterium]|nr:hypothetical protein [Clostridia bacterium]
MNNNLPKTVDGDDFSLLDKNTVKATGQLTDSRSVRFFGAENKGIRIMFVGNSITLHGVLKEIGWNN